MTSAPSPTLVDRYKPVIVWSAAGLGVAVIYAFVFELTSSIGLGLAVRSAAANALSMIALGFGVFHLTAYRPASLFWSSCWHAFFAAGFVLLWMAGIVLISAALEGMISGQWLWWWFQGPALTWQIMQGLFIYAMIAFASSYAQLARLQKIDDQSANDVMPQPGKPKLILVQQDEGLVPINPDSIQAVEATGDYVRLVRIQGSLLVKMTLAETERRLTPSGFVRVHRSWLVRLESVGLIEPTGPGRWRAVLAGGDEIPVSKTGMKMLRELVL